jgi:hypothetical protein
MSIAIEGRRLEWRRLGPLLPVLRGARPGDSNADSNAATRCEPIRDLRAASTRKQTSANGKRPFARTYGTGGLRRSRSVST